MSVCSMASLRGGSMTAATQMGRTGSTLFRGPTRTSAVRHRPRTRPSSQNVKCQTLHTAKHSQMKTFLLGAILAVSCTSFAQSDRPVPRADQNSMTAHSQLLEKARAGGIDIYF